MDKITLDHPIAALPAARPGPSIMPYSMPIA
jgi:hypothetical protein